MVPDVEDFVTACDPGGFKKGNAIARFSCGKLFFVEQQPHEFTRGLCYTLVIEKPVLSRARNANANDLVEVAIGAGAALRGCEHTKVVWVPPARWKGSRPKKVDNDYTRSLLSAGELAVLPPELQKAGSTGDIIDAVGIGLWYLGRR